MTKIMMVTMIGMMVGSVHSETVTDDEIRDMVVHSGFYIDNGLAAKEEFLGAKELCAGDTNRFARILCELAQTNHVRIADRMIRCLGRHGTTAQLPFLYSMATNEQHGASAVKSVLRLEGVSSNSVMVTGLYLSMTNVTQRDRSDICGFFFNLTKTSYVPDALKQFGENVALRYAGTANLYFQRMDESMIRTEPSYRQSRRRLEVLRAVHRLGVSAYQINYVTNAINELVAYPEADLPE